MKVLGIGESVIDQTYLCEAGRQSCKKKQPKLSVGGPVPTALILLARLGVECTYISTIGQDENGEIIKNLLKKEKVSFLPNYEKQTKVNTMIVNPTTGTRQKIRGNITHQQIQGIEKNFLHQFDAILFDRHESHAFYEVLLKKKKTTKIIIDPSVEVSLFTLDMIRYADYPIIPIEFVTQFDTQLEKGIKKLFTLCHKPIIVTAGDMGSILFDGHEITVIPAKNIQAVDATGAGDIYRGGFAFGVLQGWDLQASATFANLVAGLQCTKPGNATAIPSNAEILLHACRTETKNYEKEL